MASVKMCYVDISLYLKMEIVVVMKQKILYRVMLIPLIKLKVKNLIFSIRTL